MSHREIQSVVPELPRLVDAWQTGTIDEASHQALTDLLRERGDARQYFLEQCQIDAELRWRFACQQQIAGTLAGQIEGPTQPIAAIILSGLGFRDDRGFPAVFDTIEASEPLARQWLRVYLTLRACMFLCLPRLSDAEGVVKSICDELAGHPLVNLSPDQFTQLAWEVASRAANRHFQGRSRGIGRTFSTILRRCLEQGGGSDLVAIYESFEACVPRHVPADVLQLLCMRYLLERTPETIASSLHLPEHAVRSQLAQGRLLIWKSCAAQVAGCQVPEKFKVFSAFTSILDQSREQVVDNGRRVSNENLWHELDAWTESSEGNCRQFLTFAILHEALFRRLSLNHLLEVSKTRKDEEFHRVVTEMVLRLEESSIQGRHLSEPRRRSAPKRNVVAWVTATAAALLIAASTTLWWGSSSPEVPRAAPPVADAGAPLVEPILSEPIPSEPVLSRAIVGLVKATLQVEGPGSEALRQGAPIYADERIDIAAGIVHLSTPSGSEWVLEGPISVVMKEREEISLIRGKLVGLNKGQGEPLIVQTPVARVVDKGTEFGVSVGEDQTTSVAVYDGAIELSCTGDGDAGRANRVLKIEADFEASVVQGGILPAEPIRSLHDRKFIRPDEVALREEQQQGSLDAAEKVAFFELLRVEGLLAYQGFVGVSAAEEFMVGFVPPRSSVPLEFGADLAPGEGGGPSSNSLLLANGNTVFLDLDVSDSSPLAGAQLLDASRFVGGRETAVWLSWRSKSMLPTDHRFHWAGLSLMHGDSRQSQEPIFLGQPAGTPYLGLQVFNSQEEIIQPLDLDPSAPGAQEMASDDRPRLWVARITIHASGAGTVSAWCDIDPGQTETTPPHAEQQVENLKFDRIRLEVSPEGDSGQCAFDEVYLTSSLEALMEAMARRHPQATP